jgi:hypothetical protein
MFIPKHPDAQGPKHSDAQGPKHSDTQGKIEIKEIRKGTSMVV